MVADADAELFDVVDEHNQVIGREKRAKVHQLGLYHRAVYCLVFNPEGELLVQRRSPWKKIGPNQWDLSIAEHLQPGESFREAAQRGLQEELGIQVDSNALQGPLLPTHFRKLVAFNGTFTDCEFVELYRLDGWTGDVNIDTEEVSEVVWTGLAECMARMRQEPEDFTSWFRAEMALMRWLDVPRAEAVDEGQK